MQLTARCALQDNRQAIFDCGEEGTEVYAALKGMKFLLGGQASADELARQAAALYQRATPGELLALGSMEIRGSSAVHAYLEGGRWQVPERPEEVYDEMAQAVRHGRRRRRAAVAAAALLASAAGMAAAGVGLLLAQLPLSAWRQEYS